MSIDPRNTREDSQRKVFEEIIKDGVCPFCRNHLSKYHKPQIHERVYWLVTENQWPYKGAKKHTLIILRRHEEDISSLKYNEWLELLSILKEVSKEEGVSGGAIGMRFGDTLSSGATVNHIHAHIVVPDTDDLDYEPIKFYVGGHR